MRQIQNLIILILAARTLAGAAGDPSSPPDLNTGGDSRAASNRASEIARGVPGVRDVKNELVDLAQPRLKDTSQPSRRRSGTSSGG
jgi:hypothetical protein